MAAYGAGDMMAIREPEIWSHNKSPLLQKPKLVNVRLHCYFEWTTLHCRRIVCSWQAAENLQSPPTVPHSLNTIHHKELKKKIPIDTCLF